MTATRRDWMGAALALTGGAGLAAAGAGVGQAAPPRRARAVNATTAIPPRPSTGFTVISRGKGRDYAKALAALQAYALHELEVWGLPGMTLCVTDDEGFAAHVAIGWADLAAHAPMTHGRRFQIGSISKSFLALAVIALADQGKVDLDAPMARYLPDVPLPAEPITVAQVLGHEAGLPDGAPVFPRTPDGRLWSGFTPGAAWSYSNTGYELLGRLVEHVTGQPHHVAVTRLVRAPLGLSRIEGVIRAQARAEYAVGYWPAGQGAGNLPGDAQEMAYWTEEDTSAGSVGATSAEMAVYVRALLRLGRGQGAPLFSDALAARFARPGTTAAHDFGPGAHYALGVGVVPVDGVPILHHTGGMMSFSSSFHADAAAGVGAFASVNARNSNYRPRLTTAYAVRLMRAVRAGKPLPAAPDPLTGHHLADPAAWAGTYRGGGLQLELRPSAAGLTLVSGGRVAQVGPQGPDRLVTNHPSLQTWGLDAVRAGGAVAGLWWGETLLTRDGAALPAPPPTPQALKAMTGVYINRDPWVGGGAVVARGETLVLEGAGPLVNRGDYWSLAMDKGGVERFRFEAPLNGRPFRVSFSGHDLLRITT